MTGKQIADWWDKGGDFDYLSEADLAGKIDAAIAEAVAAERQACLQEAITETTAYHQAGCLTGLGTAIIYRISARRGRSRENRSAETE